jgi:hypothetical protein
MRVPIYPDDLIRNRGFKSLSKQLQQHWCGPAPISLADAQKALAQGLGYLSFHDLCETSKVCPPNEPVPHEADVRKAIASAIKATLVPETSPPVDQQKLEQLVDDLSLEKLIAFKRAQVSPAAGRSPLPKRASVPKPGLSKEDVQTLEKILAESGSLRDRALFACMLGNLRQNEFLSARIQDGYAIFAVKDIYGPANVHEAIPSSHRPTFEQYVKASRLSEGDYLFQAPGDRKNPLSTFALRRICASWARKANIHPSLLTPHNIRKTSDGYAEWMHLINRQATANRANTSLADLAKLMDGSVP